jgi:exodeoxyribonuclease V beta subunit
LWSISSYSALVKDAARSTPVASGDLPVRVLRDDEPAEPAQPADRADREDRAGGTAAGGAADPAWHRFPRGAFAGNFLHDQLEWLAGEGFALVDKPALQKALLRRCERQGWGHRADDVLAWLARVCSTPLPGLGSSLAGLLRALPEMEFWFPSDGLRARAVDALCRAHVLPGRPRPELPERALRGMLMGFTDLVFEHGGRYGVLDYKSNALGVRDADYTLAAMETAMLAHRYDVQAALYLLALHRLLKSRLGSAYAPAAHLHGAVYLFLRGVNSERKGCFHLPAPLALIEALDAMLTPAAGALAGEAA